MGVAISVWNAVSTRSQFSWSAKLRKNWESHIDASHSRQPLVKGERLVRYEVNAVIDYIGFPWLSCHRDSTRPSIIAIPWTFWWRTLLLVRWACWWACTHNLPTRVHTSSSVLSYFALVRWASWWVCAYNLLTRIRASSSVFRYLLPHRGVLPLAQCHASATRMKAPKQAQEDTSPTKIDVTSKSPVGDISVVTLIRTDTTLDHSQKAEKVWVARVEGLREGSAIPANCPLKSWTRCIVQGFVLPLADLNVVYNGMVGRQLATAR